MAIMSFKGRRTNELFNRKRVKTFASFERAARRKLELINAAASLDDLRHPLGNRLEKFRGDREGQHSIRINDQWRVCFNWKTKGVFNVEIADYH